MKKSTREIVRRTGGRDTALEAFNGRGYFKMPWEGASFGATNDAVFEMRRAG